MSNEETGKLIDDIRNALLGSNIFFSFAQMAEVVAGELQSRYRIEPLENTVEEEATK